MSMIPMRNSAGWKFALMYDPGHQQHGWIFYDNHGTWVTFRRATDQEMQVAATLAMPSAPAPQTDRGEGRDDA